MPKLLFAGTSSGYAVKNRNPSCVVYSTKDVAFLIDCGDGATHSLLNLGFDIDIFDAAIITHMHPDHVGGLMFFIQTLHLMKRKRPFYLFVPSEVSRFIPQSLNHHYMFPETLGFDLRIQAIHSAESMNIGDVNFLARPNRHMTIHSDVMSNHRNLLGEAFSLSIRYKNTRAVYTSDIKDFADLAAIVHGGGDLLVAETAHIDEKHLPGLLDKHPFRKVVLTHIPPEKERAFVPKAEYIRAKDGLIVDF